MDKNSVMFGNRIRSGVVDYVIDDKIVYFHQTQGIYSSINGAEEIIEAVSQREGIDSKKYRWIDIQTADRYSKYDQCEIVHKSDGFGIDWVTVDVPDQVLKILL